MRLFALTLALSFIAPLLAQGTHANKPITRTNILDGYRPTAEQNSPQIKPMLFSPEYQLQGEERHLYGWCFMTYHPDSLFPILVTAHSVFTRNAGLNRNLSANELGKRLQSFKATAMNDVSMVIDKGNVLQINEAQSLTRDRYDNDLAAILLFKNYPGYGTQLRRTSPEVGETLWLHAPIAQADQKPWFLGKVTFSDETGLELVMNRNDLNLRTVTGSPLVDHKGEIAGMMLQTSKADDGQLYVLAISGKQIYEHISTALKRQ